MFLRTSAQKNYCIFSQHWIQHFKIHLSESQGSNSGFNTYIAMTVGLVLQLGRFSDPESACHTSVWATAMLTMSFLHKVLSDCNALSLRPYSFTFPGRDASLPSLGRPQLQHPVIIWWTQLSASLLQKSMLMASRWFSEEWWLVGSNTCRVM